MARGARPVRMSLSGRRVSREVGSYGKDRSTREPRVAKTRAPRDRVADFSDEALLSELAEEDELDGGFGTDADARGDLHGQSSESLEQLEREIRRELANTRDWMCDEEAAIRRDIETQNLDPDEGTAMYLLLMHYENSDREKRKTERLAVAASIHASQRRETVEVLTVEWAALRQTAVRLKKEGNLDGARDALRRSKEVKLEIEKIETEANETGAASRPHDTPSENDSRANSHDKTVITEVSVKSVKLEAVRLKRFGDMEGARYALRRAKETQAELDLKNDSRENESYENCDENPHNTDPTLGVRQSADLQALMDAARQEALMENFGDGDDGEDDDETENEKLLAEELGADHSDDHFAGNPPDGRDDDGNLCHDAHPGVMLQEELDLLTQQILETKKKSLVCKRAGDVAAAREFLRDAKRLQAKLDETRVEFGGLA